MFEEFKNTEANSMKASDKLKRTALCTEELVSFFNIYSFQ
jgi:hypothetical protein